MNILDKFYYSLQKDSGPSTKVFLGIVFFVMGLAGLILIKHNLSHTLGALSMFFLGIASFLSVHTFFPNWNINSDRFPNGLRKFVIIVFQLFGFLSIILAIIIQILTL